MADNSARLPPGIGAPAPNRSASDAKTGIRRAAAGWWPALLVLLLAVPALQPLWQAGLQQTNDGLHHLFRTFSLDLALRSGYWVPRWLAYEGFGYGFPVLNFYAPLGYYLQEALYLLVPGAGFATSFELSLALGIVGGALAMYAFARELLGNWGAAVAAVTYVWAPYHLADAWTRGALAEHLALIWLPLLLLALLRLVRSRGREILWPLSWGGAVLGALILTHNLTVILAAPLLLAWAAYLLAVEAGSWANRGRCATGFVLLAGLGVALSAFFWIPAVQESGDVWAAHVPGSSESVLATLAPPAELVDRSWTHQLPAGQQIGTLYAVGQAQLAVAVLGLAVGLWRWRWLPRVVRWALPLFASVALLALFLQSTWSRPLWQALPGLRLLQFAWRWQALATLALSALSGYAAFALARQHGKAERLRPQSSPAPRSEASPGIPRRRPRLVKIPVWLGETVLLAAVAVVLMSGALPRINWAPAILPGAETPVSDEKVGFQSLAAYDYWRGLWLREHGDPWMFEYMPRWAESQRADFFVSAGAAAAGGEPLAAQVVPGRQAAQERRFTVNSPVPWTMQLHQFYFPGWEARVDGQKVAVEPAGPLALAGVAIPAGEHEVVFRFGTTDSRMAGLILSAMGGLCLIGILMWGRRRWKLAGLGAASALAVALFLCHAAASPSTLTPASVGVRFGGEAALVGYVASPTQLRPSAETTVTLYWLALRRPEADYKVFVQLVDAEGNVWAQHDGEPGFFHSPTTRWQEGEIVEDRHVLLFKGNPPPGRYQLRVGLYDPVKNERLPVLGPGGQALDNQVLLGDLAIE